MGQPSSRRQGLDVVDPLDIAHLLRRTEFVARPERVAALSAMSLEQAVDDVLDIGRNGVTEIPGYLQTEDRPQEFWQYQYAYHWWLDRMVDRPRPFQERMTLFWQGHFTSALHGVVYRMDVMFRQNHLYRQLALGNFRELTHRMALEPAMLVYLSNHLNVAGNPNENFARELMELFTIGVGNYSEADVANASRAWTGHGLDASAAYVFRPELHDGGLKSIFGTTKNWDGPDLIDEILRDNPAKKRVAATFIVRKLWEHFASPRPVDQVVDALADVFLDADLELRPLMRAMFLRPEFYAPAAKWALVRSPAEFIVAALYHLRTNADSIAAEWRSGPMGQLLFDPPNVAGWKGGSAWLTTSALSGRAALAAAESYRICTGNDFQGVNAMTPADAVDHVARYFGIFPLSTPSRDALIDGVRIGRAANDWYTTVNLITAAMLTPEFHLA